MDPSLLSLSDQQTIAQQVFYTMAGIEVIACDCSLVAADNISSTLTFSQGTEGIIVIDCNPELAYAFTSGLMSIDLPDSVDADVLDAMGELVNMIGGNLKGLLPSTTNISTPSIISPEQRHELIAGMEQVSHSCYSSGAGHCRIGLYKHNIQ